MATVKWIKLTVDMFDDEKVKLIEAMPEADSIIILWIKLLCLAGKLNDGGAIYLSEYIPYTDEMLATVFNRPISVVRLALQTFEKLKMIDFADSRIIVANWEKHQNIEGLEKLKENNRIRARNYRKRLAQVGGYSYLEHYPEIYQRDGGKCVYCGTTEKLGLDHLIPLIKGGDNEIDNLVLACKQCNAGKSGRLIEECNYSFHNPPTEQQYQTVHQRIYVTESVTDRHAIDKTRLDKTRKEKKRYKEHVFLFPQEHQRLIDEYGQDVIEEYIDRLNDYIGSKGKRYKSHYHTIRTWLRKNGVEKKTPEKKCPKCGAEYISNYCTCGFSE